MQREAQDTFNAKTNELPQVIFLELAYKYNNKWMYIQLIYKNKVEFQRLVIFKIIYHKVIPKKPLSLFPLNSSV